MMRDRKFINERGKKMNIHKKDEVSYSTIFNLFYCEIPNGQVLYGKKEDLLNFFCISFELERDDYRRITDDTNIIYHLTRLSDTDTWYKVKCQLENNCVRETHELVGTVSKEDAIELDNFMLKYNKHLETDYEFDSHGNLQKVNSKAKKGKNALNQLYKQEDVLHIDTENCDLFSNTSEFDQLQKTIYNALEEILRLSEFEKNRDYEEYEFAHKVAHLIDDLEAQVRIMNLAYKNWYHIKEKKGEIKE